MLSLGFAPRPPLRRHRAVRRPRRPISTASFASASAALIHPGTALAMLADEGRIPRRLAAHAIAKVGPVMLARRVIEAASGGARAGLRAIVETALGVTPAQ